MKYSIEIKERQPIFLVQRIFDDGTKFASLMDEHDLCEYLCMDDCHNEQYEIWDVTIHGEIYKCHYVGWQPNCLIEVRRDFDNKVVLSMHGEDH